MYFFKLKIQLKKFKNAVSLALIPRFKFRLCFPKRPCLILVMGRVLTPFLPRYGDWPAPGHATRELAHEIKFL